MAWQSVNVHTFLSLPIALTRINFATVFIVITIAIHVFLFYATNSIFFTTPVVQPIKKVYKPNIVEPLAKRVVVFSVDGLRAKVLFRNNLESAIHLRHQVIKRGVWGVSYGRSPSLSRSGHLSLFSGVYEYMHGLTRGRWENPFDHVFNRSREAWLFGEDEIVEMFITQPWPPHVHTWSYPPTMNDFSMKDPRDLDTVIIDRIDNFFHNLTTFKTIGQRLKTESELTFFAHLLGVDTYSHSHRAVGKGLQRVVAAVDAGIKRTEEIFEQFFNHDGRTAYIVSSDHGMADWNAHAAGDTKDETMTPFIAWGAGIRRPIHNPIEDRHDSNWGIPVRRLDIAQVDICTLIAALTGLVFPVNSVGRVPLEALNATAVMKLEIIRTNALQTLEQFLELQRQVKQKSVHFLFRPYSPLTQEAINSHKKRASELANSGHYNQAIAVYDHLIKLSVTGLYYYHRYHNLFEQTTISITFILILVCCVLSTLSHDKDVSDKDVFTINEICVFVSLLASQFVYSLLDTRSPLQLIYWTFMVYLLWSVYRNCARLRSITFSVHGLVEKLLCICGLELLVWAYFYRPLISVAVIGQMVWQVATTTKETRHTTVLPLFIIGSIILTIFPMLPTVGLYSNIYLVSLGSLFTVVVIAAILINYLRAPLHSKQVLALIVFQLVLLVFACFIHFRTHSSVQQGTGLPTGTIIMTRGILIATAIIVLLSGFISSIPCTLLQIYLTVTIVFTLFSMAYETIFITVFFSTLFLWVKLNNTDITTDISKLNISNSDNNHRLVLHSSVETNHTSIQNKFFVHMYSYTVFIYLSCYGNGNFPTISSYDPHWVLTFQAVFDLAVMGVVMFLRNMLPVLLVTSPLLCLLANIDLLQIFRMAILYADFIVLHFFFRLHHTDDSILLGTMVNHFAIAVAFPAMVSFCFIISRLLISHRL